MITKLMLKQGLNKKIIVPIRRMLNKRKLKRADISIISSNCIGGCISHDLGLRFLSPTINLFFDAEDYIKFVENLEFYSKLQVGECRCDKDYPVGELGEGNDKIRIHFLHYSDFDVAKEKWEERIQRINWENIVCVFTDQNNCTEDLVNRFDKVPYKKVMFTSKQTYEYDFCVYLSDRKIKTQRGRSTVDDACIFRGLSGRRNYEAEFDIINFLNKED